jgi:hypothetical protein
MGWSIWRFALFYSAGRVYHMNYGRDPLAILAAFGMRSPLSFARSFAMNFAVDLAMNFTMTFARIFAMNEQYAQLFNRLEPRDVPRPSCFQCPK